MNAVAPHLTAEDLDLLLEATPPAKVASHLATCPSCRELAIADRRLVAALESLPTWDPSPQFVQRVMSEVVAPPVAVPVVAGPSERERSARRRVLIGGSILGGLVTAGFAWAFANPGNALGLVEPAIQQAGQTLWVSVQALSANASEQPWFVPLRDALATPARAVPTLMGVGALYLVLLLSLRRLLNRPATDAGY